MTSISHTAAARRRPSRVRPRGCRPEPTARIVSFRHDLAIKTLAQLGFVRAFELPVEVESQVGPELLGLDRLECAIAGQRLLELSLGERRHCVVGVDRRLELPRPASIAAAIGQRIQEQAQSRRIARRRLGPPPGGVVIPRSLAQDMFQIEPIRLQPRVPRRRQSVLPQRLDRSFDLALFERDRLEKRQASHARLSKRPRSPVIRKPLTPPPPAQTRGQTNLEGIHLKSDRGGLERKDELLQRRISVAPSRTRSDNGRAGLGIVEGKRQQLAIPNLGLEVSVRSKERRRQPIKDLPVARTTSKRALAELDRAVEMARAHKLVDHLSHPERVPLGRCELIDDRLGAFQVA